MTSITLLFQLSLRGIMLEILTSSLLAFTFFAKDTIDSTNLEFYTSVAKGLKLRVRKFSELIGFHFRHGLWLPFVPAFAVLKGLIDFDDCPVVILEAMVCPTVFSWISTHILSNTWETIASRESWIIETGIPTKYWVLRTGHSKAGSRGVLWKKVFLEFSQVLQRNSSVEVFF